MAFGAAMMIVSHGRKHDDEHIELDDNDRGSAGAGEE